MKDGARSLGVGISGVGWCATEHIKAYLKNPHTRVTWLHGRDEERVKANLARYGVSVPDARFTTRYEDLLESDDVQIVSITTPTTFTPTGGAAEGGQAHVLEIPGMPPSS